MSDFIKILTHGRRLQAAVKEIDIETLEEVAGKLSNIIETRKQQEADLLQAENDKKEKLDAIRKQMEDAGINWEDIAEMGPPRSSRLGQKRPVKYSYTDSEGNEHRWTGIGRMPKVFAKLLEQGKKLEDFQI